MRTALYLLVPIARRDDPNWGRAQGHGDILVRARSSGEARAIAARAETAAAGGGLLTTTVAMASAFRDSALYGVRRVDDATHAAAGPPGVLAGRFTFPAGPPVSHDD